MRRRDAIRGLVAAPLLASAGLGLARPATAQSEAPAEAPSPASYLENVEPQSFTPDIPVPWTALAASHCVVTATLKAPVDDLRRRLAEGEHTYVDVELESPEPLFGELGSTPPTLRYYSRPLPSAPHPEHLIALNGAPVIACLAVLEQRYNRGLYFAGYAPSALRRSSEALLNSTRAELTEQAKLLDRYLRRRPEDKEPEEELVEELIIRLGQYSEATVAWNELHSLGSKIAPAVIRHMDDRRPVAVEALPFYTRKGPSGGPAHFAPQLVVDALSGLLNEMSGVAFGGIHNGASERERVTEIRAWRIWRMKQPGAP